MKITNPQIYHQGLAWLRVTEPDPPQRHFYCDEDTGLFVINPKDARRSVIFSWCLPMKGKKNAGRVEMFRGRRRKRGHAWQIDKPATDSGKHCHDCFKGFHCRHCACCKVKAVLTGKEAAKAARKAANAEKLKGVPF